MGDFEVPTIDKEDQKFLGRMLFFKGKEKDALEYIKDKIKAKLTNLDKALIRGEFKLAVYSRYLLPSLRFMLTVHDLTETSLKILDDISEKFIKKWAGLPPCATRSVLHYDKAMAIPTLSKVYKESHALALTRGREQCHMTPIPRASAGAGRN